MRSPTNTIFALISDLYEGGVEAELLQRANPLVTAGVNVIVLLALSDEGMPAYDHQLAAALGASSFACTPDLFPDRMAAAIARADVAAWASNKSIALG